MRNSPNRIVGVGLAESTDVAVGPLVAASVFTTVVGGHCALLVRRGARAARPAPAGSAVAGRTSLLGLVAGALLVAALTTPALAATEAGALAVPHGEHGGGDSVTDVAPGEDGHRH